MNEETKKNDVFELICGKMLRVLDAEDNASDSFLNKQHVFIVGSKGIPAQYGGFETYVEKMVEYQTDKNIQFHVARLADNEMNTTVLSALMSKYRTSAQQKRFTTMLLLWISVLNTAVA